MRPTPTIERFTVTGFTWEDPHGGRQVRIVCPDGHGEWLVLSDQAVGYWQSAEHARSFAEELAADGYDVDAEVWLAIASVMAEASS